MLRNVNLAYRLKVLFAHPHQVISFIAFSFFSRLNIQAFSAFLVSFFIYKHFRRLYLVSYVFRSVPRDHASRLMLFRSAATEDYYRTTLP